MAANTTGELQHTTHQWHYHPYMPGPDGCQYPDVGGADYCGCPKECHASVPYGSVVVEN